MANTKIQWAEKIIHRFWSYVDKTDGCWLWKAGCFRNGYGQFRVGSKKVKAHRFAYELSHGPIAGGMCVCHRCDIPPCVNPEHLFLGTHKDNGEDKSHKGRAPKGQQHWTYINPSRRLRGEENGAVKLNRGQVKVIRALRTYKKSSYSVLSAAFGISKSQVANIINLRSWRGI